MKFILIILSSILSYNILSDDHKHDFHDHSSADWQIKTYSSAAPSFIGDFATVIGGNGEILREGANGWICQHGNPRPFPKMVAPAKPRTLFSFSPRPLMTTCC